jgi:hypothetical protein
VIKTFLGSSFVTFWCATLQRIIDNFYVTQTNFEFIDLICVGDHSTLESNTYETISGGIKMSMMTLTKRKHTKHHNISDHIHSNYISVVLLHPSLYNY